MKIKIPNLPDSRVTTAAVGEDYPEIIRRLKSLGIRIISVPADSGLQPCERSHPDMRIHHLGDNRVIVYRQDRFLACELEKNGFKVIFADREKSGKYPLCAGLNALRIGNILLCSKKCADPRLIAEAQALKLDITDCNQGYSRCAACVVSRDAVITLDKSVYNSLKDKIDVLLISSGNIRLSNSEDGMIGGASFLIDKKVVAFFGDITRHPDYIQIKTFFGKHGVNYICLMDGMLCDVGSVIPLEIQNTAK